MIKKKKDSTSLDFSYDGYTKGQLIRAIKAKRATIDRYTLEIAKYARIFENQKLRITHIKKQLDFLTDHPWSLKTGSRTAVKE